MSPANGSLHPEKPALPKRHRALVLQGGGAVGAYEAGVYRVLFDWISDQIGDNENVFDVIAGTSIGAINGAVLVSQVLKNKKETKSSSSSIKKSWKDSADMLEEFWNHTKTIYFFTSWLDPSYWVWDLFHDSSKALKQSWNTWLEETASREYAQNNQLLKDWYQYLDFIAEAWDIPASGEATRRYWSTRLPFPFPLLGAPNFASAIPRFDFRFWDNPAALTWRGYQERIPLYYMNPSYSLRDTLLDTSRLFPLCLASTVHLEEEAKRNRTCCRLHLPLLQALKP